MIRSVAVGCPRWPIVAHDLHPDAQAAVFFANRVVSASVEAAAYGIRRGMRRREAQAHCPEMEVITHDPARDTRIYERIVSVVESFAPRVEVVRPGLCVLAARGPARYFGGEQELRERIAAKVDEALEEMRTHPLHPDDRTRVGIADGPFAAELAAVRGLVVPRGESASFLSGFGVDVLDQPALCDLLRRLGIRTLGDLAALDAGRVVARFGSDGAIAHRLARADDTRLLEPRAVPPDLTVSRELDPPAHRVDAAMFVGKSLADSLAARLSGLGLACAKIAITAQTEHGEERTRVWRYSAAFTPAAIAERVRWQLEGWLHEEAALSGGISLIRLEPQDVGPATGSRASLWGRRGDVTDRVRRAIARVQGLAGPNGAQAARMQGGRHPSEQVRFVPWGDPTGDVRPGAPGDAKAAGPIEVEMPPWPGRLPSPAPALAFSEPRTAEVVDTHGAPVGVSGRFVVVAPPARVKLGSRWLDVVAWAGPWPTDERWWDAESHRRRARFQIALSDGTAHLFALEDGRFSVEATYD